MIYRICPGCGAHLDPGERCDCQNEKELPGATNTEQLRVEQKSDELNCFTLSLPKNERECQV